MRGTDHQQSHMFSYLSPEARVRKDPPLRVIRTMVDEVLRALSPQFDPMYASEGRPSIAPEKLLRAQLLQMLYSIRSERLLMEEIDYSVLFRWLKDLKLKRQLLTRYSIEEFVAVLAEHVPDRYRHGMRYFGLLAPSRKAQTSAALFALLGQEKRPRPPRLSWANSLRKHFGVDPLVDSEGRTMHWKGRLSPVAS